MPEPNLKDLIGFDPDELLENQELPPGNPVRYAREAEERNGHVRVVLEKLVAKVDALEQRFADLMESVKREQARPITFSPEIKVQPADVVVKQMPAPKVEVNVSPTPVNVEVQPAKVEIQPQAPAAPRGERDFEIHRDKDGTLHGKIKDAKKG